MRMLKTNVVRLFISTVMMGFLIIYMVGGSIVEAGDEESGFNRSCYPGPLGRG